MSGMPPITASGGSTQYERMYKKHFGNRGPSFALRDKFTPSSLTSASTSSTPSPSLDAAASPSSGMMDPFAGSFVVSASHPRTVPSSQSTSPVSSHAVDDATQAALQNLGYRIRSRISLGYNRSHSSANAFDSSSTCSAYAPVPATEREVLHSVTNNPRTWSRVKSAPAVAADFCGLRSSTCPTLNGVRESTDAIDADGDATMDIEPSDTTVMPAWRKRSRELDLDEPQTMLPPAPSTPTLSFSSSHSSNSAFLPDPTPFSFQRVASERRIKPLPIPSALNTDRALPCHHMPSLQNPQPSSPTRYDFQDWINRTDF